ncbi:MULTISPECIES: LytTR family transcriptional regulator DNA-binding domain-containing protein [unclassified Ekhidna]|jgi:two-component system response regulator LytT|uniref:LytR/AlgR family response regulator transcription factor n=1 Tax=unclassified Ekhidna TaxID=2632188 RepID=UPI0032E03EC4
MNKFNIVIVDDELMIAEMTKEMLLELGYNVVGIAKNHEEADLIFSSPQQIDLVILDINLSEQKDGIDLAREIEKKYKFPFIYLTSYSDPRTIKKASSTTPAAYLLKPFTQDDLFTTIEFLRARGKKSTEFVFLKVGAKKVKISVQDIYYIKSDNNYLDVVTEEKKFIIRNSLDNFLSELKTNDLVRVHRSYAVNIQKVKAINGQYLLIKDIKCPISRSNKREVSDLLSGKK